MNTGERLVFLSGLSGVSAATHLLAIGLGATTGQALVDYSQLASATAEVHLLAEPAQSIHVVSGGTFEQANHEWEAKRKWRIEANKFAQGDYVLEPKKVKAKTLEVSEILPRLDVPVLTLKDLLADVQLLQIDTALEKAMLERDVLRVAELAYLAELAVQQEKDAIVAFVMFME